jgi:hypothetical protein
VGKLIDLTGNKYGRLSVLQRAENIGSQPAWDCVCDCGVRKPRVLGYELRDGGTQSCGCWRNEVTGKAVEKHGLSRAHYREFRIWCGIKSRLTRPKDISFKYYGALGVTMCERWNNFGAFFADMGERPSPTHSIDRKDPHGNYEPSNCRWATKKEQVANQRHKAAEVMR